MAQSNSLTLAQHYLNTNNPERALNELAKANDLSYEFWYISAQCYFEIKQFKEAKNALLEGLVAYPDDLYLLYLLTSCERRLGNHLEAEKRVERLRELYSKRADVLELFSRVKLDLNKFKAMHEAFIKAKELRAEAPNSLLNASVALMHGKQKTAIKHTLLALAKNPEDAKVHSIAAEAYKKDWQLDAALEYAIKSARLEPSQSYYRLQVQRARIMIHPLYKPIAMLGRFNSHNRQMPAKLLLTFSFALWAIALISEQSYLGIIAVVAGFSPFAIFVLYWSIVNIVLNIYFDKKPINA